MTPSQSLINNLSDKVNSPGSKSHHNYNEVYDRLLSPYRESATAVLELGVMHGCSLRAWRDYFYFADIIGIDNDESRLIRENRIRCFHADTTDRDRFIALSNTFPQFDIIIDDASHVFNEQLFAVAVLWPKLKSGGLFIVEDITTKEYLALFGCFQNVELFDVRISGGAKDDFMAVIRKVI